MPVYDYLCDNCGAFSETRPMALAAADCDCPICGNPSERAILPAPALGMRDSRKRAAHGRNERAAHAPQLSGKAERATGGHRPGVFKKAMGEVNLLQPEFVICVGDLIEGYIEDKEGLNAQWNEFDGFLNQLEMPFFYVPGNHDISNPVMAEEWQRRFGRSYYHFVYRNVLFLCLNSEDPPGTHISARQVAYVSKTLAENQGVRWTLVFLHKPC